MTAWSKNKDEALFSNIVASRDKAKEFYGLSITNTRMQLHITGSDSAETSRNGKENQNRAYVERLYAATNCTYGFGRRIRVIL